MKWLQVLILNTNYSIQQYSFSCTQSNGYMYYNIILIIQYRHTVKEFQILLYNTYYSIQVVRMLRAILNKSWRQHPTKHQLYGHLPSIMKTIQVRRTRHIGHCWRNRDKLISDGLLWTPHMAKQKKDDQLEHTYSSYVRIRNVALKTCWRRWTMGRSGERDPGISMQVARHDDDDDDDSIQHHSLIYTQLKDTKYCYASLPNQLDISYLFTHN